MYIWNWVNVPFLVHLDWWILFHQAIHQVGTPEAAASAWCWRVPLRLLGNSNLGQTKTWEKHGKKPSNIRKSVTEVFILKKFSSFANRSMETLEGQSFVCRDKSIDCDASLVGWCWCDYQEKYLGEWGLRRVDYQLDTSLVWHFTTWCGPVPPFCVAGNISVPIILHHAVVLVARKLVKRGG